MTEQLIKDIKHIQHCLINKETVSYTHLDVYKRQMEK